jgi:predicted chitinase
MAIVTLSLLTALAPSAQPGLLEKLVPALNRWLPRHGITSPLRLAHFLAQSAEETDGFKTLVEYASGKAYEGRKDLGNTQKGDGVRFKGRGIFQLTGRSNYAYYGGLTGLNLVGSPQTASQPDVAAQIAALYWDRKGLNTWADRDDIASITYRINGGRNGLAARKAYLAKAKVLLNVASDKGQYLEPEPRPEAPIGPISPSSDPWWKDPGILTIGGSAAAGAPVAFSATGVAAWALLALVIAGIAFGIYLVIQKRRAGR